METWVSIQNFKSYEVSNLGRVRSKKTKRILKPAPNKAGYLKLVLSNQGIQKTRYVHRLVATSFLSGSGVVNHIDGNKSNNNLSNLEIVTHRENTKHAYSLGLIKSKLNKVDIKNIFYAFHSGRYCVKELANMYEVSGNSIYKVIWGFRTC